MLDAKSDHEFVRIAQTMEHAVVSRDLDTLIPLFREDCVLEFSFSVLRGHTGVRQWVAWVHDNILKVRYEPISYIAGQQSLFEEFSVHGFMRSGARACSRQGKLLVFEDGLVKRQRIFFDRADFIGAMTANPTAQAIVNKVLNKSMDRLKKANL